MRQVIAKDPDFAPAYLVVPDAEQQMRATAEKAIQLDPLLAKAHAEMGVAYASDLAWGDAE